MGTAIRSRAATLILVVALGAGGLALWRARGRDVRGASSPGASSGSPAATLAERARSTGGTLAIAVEDDAGLWSGPDGTGYANDVVRAAFTAAGVPISLEVVPYARCKQMLIDGAIAACFSMSLGQERDPSVVYSAEPIFVCSSELLLRTTDARDFADPAHVPQGAVIGVVLGYEYPDALYRLERAHVVRLEASPSEDLNLRKLAQGRLDAMIVNVNRTKSLRYMAARAGVSGRVRRAFTVGELDAYVGFSRKHPRGDEARAGYDQGIQIIGANGTRARIERDWDARAAAQAASLPGSLTSSPPGDGGSP